MRRLFLSLLALAVFPAARAAAAPDPAALATAWRDLAAGVNRADVPTLLRAKEQFAMLAETDPAAAPAHRAAALAAWRAVPLLQGDAAKAQARALLDEALTHCEAALAANAGDAEALALKGSLQALLLGFVPEQTMVLGPESKGNLARAAALAPKNPRIRFLDAIYTLHSPAFFGGGADKALPEFDAAIALFDADAPGDSTAPAWGRDDALLWAGRAAEQLGRTQDAARYYGRAIEANPANGWARALLQEAAAPPKADKP